MRAAIYARYSSDNQRDASIEDQVAICRERAEREGWIVAKVYSDRAVSGASLIRKGIQALIEDARDGHFDIVLTESLDRLSRDQEDIAGLYKRLGFAGIRIVTLSEGEISELHIGLKGTMGALYLKDLADKTRRGLRGRIKEGKSGGGRSYGYVVVRRLNADGEPMTGERAIDPGEAAVVRGVFAAYAAGDSPRSIALGLNREGVAGPSGRGWTASTIHGNPKRGTGLLNNELYVGRLVWNRLRYLKDPSTGRRVSRLNAAADVVETDVPDLRIVDQDLWDRVKARQADQALPERGNRGAALTARRRPVHLLSGLLTCGQCGGGMSKISATHVGCSAARNKGLCAMRRAISRTEVEERVLGALGQRLMDPELFAVFCAEFTAETNRLAAAAATEADAEVRELARVRRDLDRLVQALIDGAPVSSVKEKMVALEARRDELEGQISARKAPPPRLHPAMADIYRAKVADLSKALNAPETRTEAAEILRGLIESIVLTHDGARWNIDLRGDLAGILTLAEGRNAKTTAGTSRAAVSQVPLVAGAGYHLCRTRGYLSLA